MTTPIECRDWLYHMHFLRSEFTVCEQQISRSEVKSDYSHYVRSLIRLREDGDAVAALNHLSHMQADSPLHLKQVIRCLVLSGRHTEVTDKMRERGLIACPTDWQVWHLIGLSFFHTNRLPLAKDAFQRATQSCSSADPFLLLAKCHVAEKDVKSAIFVLRKACEAVSDWRIRHRLAVLLLASGMTAKGCEEMLQLQHMACHMNLPLALGVGSVLWQSRQDVDGALFRYKMTGTTDNGSVWHDVALCFAHRNKVVGAMSCLKRAHMLQPLEWRTAFNLALMHMQMRLFASAFHFLLPAAAYSHASAIVLSLLALAADSLQDTVNAERAHKAATQSAVSSSSPTPILNYAVFLIKKDKNQHREQITDLMMEFEKCWVKRRQNDGDFDLQTMRLATNIATVMEIVHHMAWIRERSRDELLSATASGDTDEVVQDQ